MLLRRWASKAARAAPHQDRPHVMLSEQYKRVEHLISSNERELIAASVAQFQHRQEELVQWRCTEAFRKSYSPKYHRELKKVSGPATPFNPKAVPTDLHDRKLELTGPSSDPAMVITALNSKSAGVSVFMGDAEDASTMSAANTAATIENNYGVARRTLTAQKQDADGSVKKYELGSDLATYIFRVPGLHLPLPSVTFENKPVSAFLFHTALYAAQNGAALRAAGSGTYFYVPKLEGQAEAQFVNEYYNWLEDQLGWSRGTIKASVLVESWPTIVDLPRVVEAFKKDDHIVAINAARWDYFAHLHKTFGAQSTFAPRSQLTMDLPFMEDYIQRIVHVGHHYGIHAIGGMSAFIPVKNEDVNRVAMDKAKEDKQKEFRAGLDGAWIAHPGMANIRQVFDQMKTPHQIATAHPSDVHSIADITPKFEDPVVQTDDLRYNIRIALEYLAAWISGRGAVALNDLMEDAATMEISRYNLWNHRKQKVVLADTGAVVDAPLLKTLVKEVVDNLKSGNTQVPYAADHFDTANEILLDSILTDAPPAYLTLPALNSLKEGPPVDVLSASKVGSCNFGPDKTMKYGYFDRRGVVLARYRGLKLNQLVRENKKPVVFLGCYTGPVAQQYAKFGAHLYGGGWQGNAALNRDKQPYPDTLFVTQGDAYDVSELFTNYLEAAKINQELSIFEKIEAVKQNTTLSKEDKAKKIESLRQSQRMDYEAVSVLIDGENGWGSEDKVINLVRNLVKRGVNLIHIEDQIEKRCGHIGGKSVHKTETMRRLYEAARWVLHELEEHEGKQLLGVVQIIARTDALDAKFFDGSANFPTFTEDRLRNELAGMNIPIDVAQGIVDHFITQRYLRVVDPLGSDKYTKNARYLRFTSRFSDHAFHNSVNMALRSDLLPAALQAIETNPNFVPLDHRFVDWDKGHTPDGRFWHLRENCGLQLSIHRMIHVMDLCDFGWMETKDPRIDEVKLFVDGVRNYKDYFGAQPFKDFKVLYNLSPSFNWLYNFGKEASGLTKNLVNAYGKEHNFQSAEEGAKWVREQLALYGDKDQGDDEYSEQVYRNIYLTLQKGAVSTGEKGLTKLKDAVQQIEKSGEIGISDAAALSNVIQEALKPTNVREAIQLQIAEERMRLFSRMIFRCGCSLQLITLPEFHFDQLMAAKLADSFVGDDQGMLAYTRLVQQPEFEMRDKRGYDGVTHQRKAMLDFWQSVLKILDPDRPDLAKKAGTAHTEGQMDKSWKSE